VRSPPPHHRRCTRCAESNIRCSFKEAKATAAAAAASEEATSSTPRLGKRKRYSVIPSYDDDADYMVVRAERRASQPANGGGGLRRKVQEAQNLVRTIGFLFEKLDDALEDIGDAAAMHEELI
jgi:hypothetical protein